MPIIAKRRKKDRERRQKKLSAGHKPIQLMLTPEAQEVLARQKDRTGEPYVQIINRAIIGIEARIPRSSDEIKVWPPG